jgi:hypothetical protein
MSKRLAEQAAWEFATAHPQLEVVVVNPLFVSGPSISPAVNTSLCTPESAHALELVRATRAQTVCSHVSQGASGRVEGSAWLRWFCGCETVRGLDARVRTDGLSCGAARFAMLLGRMCSLRSGPKPRVSVSSAATRQARHLRLCVKRTRIFCRSARGAISQTDSLRSSPRTPSARARVRRLARRPGPWTHRGSRRAARKCAGSLSRTAGPARTLGLSTYISFDQSLRDTIDSLIAHGAVERK